MRSNCCAIAVIRSPARVRFVFSNVNTLNTLRVQLFTVHLEYGRFKSVIFIYGAHWKVKFTRITHIHLRSSNKISGTKLEPFRRRTGANCWTCFQEMCSLPDSTRTSFRTWIVISIRTEHRYAILIAKARNEFSACGSVVMYESATVRAVRSLYLNGSSGGIMEFLLGV